MKTKTIFKNVILLATLFIFSLSACKKDKTDDNSTTDATPYDSGVFVINEGAYLTGTGTISYYNRNTKKVEQDIYKTVNGAVLGNIAQSLTVFNDKAYIVINNDAKVEVVNAATFKSSGTIEGLEYPRYFVGSTTTKGYVSQWGFVSGNIAVINLSTNKIISTIDVKASGPENMLISGDKLFVINSGGYGVDSTISIIDTQADTLLAVVKVGDNPKGIEQDVNGKLWILCGGIPMWMDSVNYTKGKLVELNADTYTIEQSIEFPSGDYNPSDLVMNSDKNKLYYIYGSGVYAFDITASNISSTALFTGYFYALGYDAKTDYLYAADPIDYTQSGTIYRYKASSGDLVDSFTSGIIPGDFWFE